MALFGRSTGSGQTNPGQDLARFQHDARSLVQSGSRQPGVPEYNPSHSENVQQGQLAIAAEISAHKEAQKSAHTAYQNAQAIVEYNNKDKKKVWVGKHAAAVDQIHQNDLHNIEKVSDVNQAKDSMVMTNGMVVDLPDTSKNGSRSQQTKGAKSVRSLDRDSELITSFDPMKDRHRWAMWRTAVNGRIVDEVRRLERTKIEKGPASVDSNTAGVYGTALMVTPLKQFIRIDSDDNEAISKQMLGLGPVNLRSYQFVYFGLPRVQLAKLAK